MKLLQYNWRFSLLFSLQFLLIGVILGGLYHYRLGLDLLPPSPLPQPERPPEAREGVFPKPCVGYHSGTGTWGYQEGACPDHHAFMFNSNVGGSNKGGPGSFVQIHGMCCPLPAEDILTDEHLYTIFEACPDDYIATAGTGPCQLNCAMRCTKINTGRYQLGPERLAYYITHRNAGRKFGRGRTKRLYLEQIPVALRYGVMRDSHSHWKSDSCIGVPLGSLLTRKVSKRCDGFYYRELQYRDGTPVQMFPECDALSDAYSPEPRCLRGEEAAKAAQPIVIFE